MKIFLTENLETRRRVRHQATPWLDMVAKPWRIEAVTFRGRNLFALQIGLDFGFAKNAPRPRELLEKLDQNFKSCVAFVVVVYIPFDDQG